LLLGAAAVAALLFLNLRPKWLPTYSMRPAAYHSLIDTLARSAETYDASYLHYSVGYTMGGSTPPAYVAAKMEDLSISCLLYVHRDWYGRPQRGLVVAGHLPNWYGAATTRAYKIEGGRVGDWHDSMRPHGPVISPWRNPRRYDSCIHSG
jgi:hypothetical protein